MYTPENIPITHLVGTKGQIYPEPPQTSGKPEFMQMVDSLRKKGRKLLAIKYATTQQLIDDNSVEAQPYY